MMTLVVMGLIFPLFMIFCGFTAFVFNQKHLMNALLSLEFIMLGIFWFMVMNLSSLSNEVYLVLFFLTLSSCEGALGLSIMVSMVRTHGNHCFKTFSFLSC